MRLARGLWLWWQRRRRFAEEWAFHLEMAVSEFESLGFTRGEARRMARRRLGTFVRYRRAALRELRSDDSIFLVGLSDYAPMKSPLVVPTIIAVIMAIVLALNPQRFEEMESLARLLPFGPAPRIDRFVPLTPRGIVPMGFAALTLWSFAVIGIVRIHAGFKPRANWRVWTFGVVTLIQLVFFGDVLWATGLQILLMKRWLVDVIQGFAMITFAFAYVALASAALRVWYRDLESRCPVCLRRLGMAEVRGNAHDVLVAPLETESICLRGHGLNVQNRWGREFGPDRFPSPLG
jgi:hypothetical protein